MKPSHLGQTHHCAVNFAAPLFVCFLGSGFIFQQALVLFSATSLTLIGLENQVLFLVGLG